MSSDSIRALPGLSSALFGEDYLDSSIYTDPTVYVGELEKIFYRSWVCLGHLGEIPEEGDYKTALIGSQPVIVVRGPDDFVGVFLNRCRHRGTLLCDVPRGHVEKFVCPYHGWAYDTGGRLVGTPYPSGYDRKSFKADDYSLNRVARVETYGGFVFASMADDGPSLESHLGHARPYIDAFVGEGVVVDSGRNLFAYDGNWKLAAENVVDDYHLPFIHESYFDVLRERRPDIQPASSNPNLRAWDLGGGHGLLDFREYTADGELATVPRANVAGSLPFNLFVFPNFALAADHFRLIVPMAVDKTRVELVHVVPANVSDEEREVRIRRHEDFYGPAGFAMPDDLEVAFHRVSAGFKADAGDRRVHIGRGQHRENVDSQGRRWGHITDETPHRGFYRQWRSLVGV
jgi:phenylpropionate dioxygenase-like ring-hydroxylating dioxygenase large terminal subunit